MLSYIQMISYVIKHNQAIMNGDISNDCSCPYFFNAVQKKNTHIGEEQGCPNSINQNQRGVSDKKSITQP